MKKRNLILVTELRHGHQDIRLMDWVGPHLTIYDRAHRVAIKITELPHWVDTGNRLTIPAFLKGFAAEYREALLYLLEDSQPIPRDREIPECTFKHLTQLADFLKETI